MVQSQFGPVPKPLLAEFKVEFAGEVGLWELGRQRRDWATKEVFFVLGFEVHLWRQTSFPG